MKLLARFVKNPYVNLLMGIVLMVTSGSEVWESLEEGAANHLGAHHGVFIFGLLHLLRQLPEFFEATEYMSEGAE